MDRARGACVLCPFLISKSARAVRERCLNYRYAGSVCRLVAASHKAEKKEEEGDGAIRGAPYLTIMHR